MVVGFAWITSLPVSCVANSPCSCRPTRKYNSRPAAKLKPGCQQTFCLDIMIFLPKLMSRYFSYYCHPSGWTWPTCWRRFATFHKPHPSFQKHPPAHFLKILILGQKQRAYKKNVDRLKTGRFIALSHTFPIFICDLWLAFHQSSAT